MLRSPACCNSPIYRTTTSASHLNGAIHLGPKGPSFLASLDKEVIELTRYEEVDESESGLQIKLANQSKFLATVDGSTCFCRGIRGEKKINGKLCYTVEKSLDEKTWIPLNLDYSGFEIKIREILDKIVAFEKIPADNNILSDEENQAYDQVPFEVPFIWLGYDFDYLDIITRVDDLFIAKLLGSIEEGWKTKCWAIFERLSDMYWNVYERKFGFCMQNSEAAVTITSFQPRQEDIDKVKEKNSEIYQLLYDSVLADYDRLAPGEQTPLDNSWRSGRYGIQIFDYDCNCMYLSVKRELKKKGGELIRKEETYFVRCPSQVGHQNI